MEGIVNEEIVHDYMILNQRGPDCVGGKACFIRTGANSSIGCKAFPLKY